MGLLSGHGVLPSDNGDSVDAVTFDFTGVDNDALSVPEIGAQLGAVSAAQVIRWTQPNDRSVLLPSGTSWQVRGVFWALLISTTSCSYTRLQTIALRLILRRGGQSQLYVWSNWIILRGQLIPSIRITTGHESYTYDDAGSHFTLTTSGGGTWFAPWRHQVAKSRRRNAII